MGKDHDIGGRLYQGHGGTAQMGSRGGRWGETGVERGNWEYQGDTTCRRRIIEGLRVGRQ